MRVFTLPSLFLLLQPCFCQPAPVVQKQGLPGLILVGMNAAIKGDRPSLVAVLDNLCELDGSNYLAIKEFTDRKIVSDFLLDSPQPRLFPFDEIQIKKQIVPPPYPLGAKKDRIQGYVTVEITIDFEGRPIKAKAVAGNEYFFEIACAYALRWRMLPKTDDHPGNFRTQMTIPFRIL